MGVAVAIVCAGGVWISLCHESEGTSGGSPHYKAVREKSGFRPAALLMGTAPAL